MATRPRIHLLIYLFIAGVRVPGISGTRCSLYESKLPLHGLPKEDNMKDEWVYFCNHFSTVRPQPSLYSNLSFQYEGPLKEEVVSRHISRFSQGAAWTLCTVQPDQEMPGVSGAQLKTAWKPWHSVPCSHSTSCKKKCNALIGQLPVAPVWRGYITNPVENLDNCGHTGMLLWSVSTFAKNIFLLRKTYICMFHLLFGSYVIWIRFLFYFRQLYIITCNKN